MIAAVTKFRQVSWLMIWANSRLSGIDGPFYIDYYGAKPNKLFMGCTLLPANYDNAVIVAQGCLHRSKGKELLKNQIGAQRHISNHYWIITD